MLEDVLTKEECGACRNCCVFFNESRWEMPGITWENAERIQEFLGNKDAVEQRDGGFRMCSVIREGRTGEDSEEYRCAALDEDRGCTLPEHLKPLECSMWPLRVMEDDDRLYIALAGSCHAVNDEFIQKITELLNGGLKEKITELVKADSSIVRGYDSSYRKLVRISI
ncbi:MAG: YkgJ family cysteine cluster protein [Porcipelethomonas sp.]